MLFDQYRKSPVFADAIQVLDAIESKGFEGWLVGGCVRDAILGRPLHDIDITTSAHWEEVEDICTDAGMKVRQSGIKHGTVTVIVASEDAFEEDANPIDAPNAFEVTTYRIDSPTSSDSRHPDHVDFTESIEEDLARRDFTMNAMAWHPTRGLLDPFGGQKDMDDRIIRVVRDPKERFREDALRILRGCRFASELGFDIERETLFWMRSCKHLLLKISEERITSEMDRLLMGDHVHDAMMGCVDVLSICVPEVLSMKGFEQRTKYHKYDVLEHTAWAVQYAKKDLKVRWAAFCHDLGKPGCGFFDEDGASHFYGHACLGERIAAGLLARFSHRKGFADDVCALVRNHNDVIEPTERCVKRALHRLGGRVDLFEDLLALKKADMLAHAPEFAGQSEKMDEIQLVLDAIVDKDEAFALADLAIDGNDIIDLGIEPGCEVGRLLNLLLDAVIDGDVANEREALLELAEQERDLK